jgi:hypothetical protein
MKERLLKAAVVAEAEAGERRALVSTGALKAAALGLIAALLLCACPNGASSAGGTTVSGASASDVRKLFAGGQASETVSLSGLSGNTVYLVKVNKGASNVSAANSGSVSASAGRTDTLDANALNANTLDTLGVDTLGVNTASADTPDEETAVNGGRVSGRFTAKDGRTVTRYEMPREERAASSSGAHWHHPASFAACPPSSTRPGLHGRSGA